MNRPLRITWVVLTACGSVWISPHLPAQTPTEALLQKELQQQQIRANTRNIHEHLGQLLAEYQRNGLAGEDLQVVQAIRSVLGKLTGQQMQQVIELLQAARTADQPATAQRHSLGAYSQQKIIAVQLRQLLAEYQRQQLLDEMAQRFEQLANRQGSNLRETAALQQAAQGQATNQLDSIRQTQLELQATDQEALRDEVRQQLAKLAALAPATGQTRAQQAHQYAEQSKLQDLLGAAATDLRNGQLPSALNSQTQARDVLRELARALQPAPDRLTALRQASRELAELKARQVQIQQTTKTLAQPEPASPPAELAMAQAENTDQAGLLQRDLQKLAPTAAGLLRTAQAAMESTQASLAKQPAAAADHAQQAVQQLDKTQQAVQEQIAQALAQPGPDQPVKDQLKRLEQEVNQLLADQQKTKDQTAAAPSAAERAALAQPLGQLQTRTQQAQAQAQPLIEPAAQALAEAAQQLQKAQQTLEQSPAAAQSAQQSALTASQRALEQIRQEIARLDQAEKALGLLEELLARLARLIQGQQRLELDTALAETAPGRAPALPNLANSQRTLATETGQLRQALPTEFVAAAEPLQKAQTAMQTAQAKLEQATPPPARPLQQAALQQLHAAQKILQGLRQELAAALGQNPATADLAAMEKALEQAQQQVAQAQDQLAEAGAGQLEQLQKQQEQIAENLAQLQAAHEQGQPVAQAQQAAQQAAAELAKNNLPAAMESMQRAQQALQQAAAQQQNQPPGAAAGQPPSNQSAPESAPGAEPAPEGQAQPQPSQPQSAQALSQAAQQQAEVLAAARQLAATRQAPAAQAAMDQAAQALQNASGAVGAMAASPSTPASAASPMQAAQGALTEASAQAAASAATASSAAAAAARAQEALAQAQAALAMAAAGMGQTPGQSPSPGQGLSQSQGQSQGGSQAQGQSQAKAARQGTGDGKGNRNGAAQNGPRAKVEGQGQFVGLPPRDRAAIQQSQTEKYPEEYGGAIEQYMRALAEQTAREQQP